MRTLFARDFTVPKYLSRFTRKPHLSGSLEMSVFSKSRQDGRKGTDNLCWCSHVLLVCTVLGVWSPHQRKRINRFPMLYGNLGSIYAWFRVKVFSTVTGELVAEILNDEVASN